MKTIRRVILGMGVLIGVWVALSFIGVMFDTANATLWTTSLMWGLLASLIIMPGLVVAHHANERAIRKKAAQQEPATPALDQQPSFVDEGDRDDLLWPPEEETQEPTDRR